MHNTLPDYRFTEASLAALLQRMYLAADSTSLYGQLLRCYTEPHRHYHRQQHIHACLKLLDAVRSQASRPDEIALAIWFHDAIYDTHQADNEEQSACWAERFLREHHGDDAVIQRVAGMIRATAGHDAADDADTALMLDIDLSILGASAEVFDQYDQAIRGEYAWVDEAAYRVGRAKVLQQFLQRPVIYLTPALRQRFEVQARANLQRAIAALAG
ncbi:hypothetical protein [Pokkaliibacter plantistimulans]|nr:hypothetical protein [Pokkaliibacter plantistimulans]